jgi:hypothetical protein
MNPYLGVLIRDAVQPFEGAYGVVQAKALTPDASRQSPRIYSALAQGGGVLFDEAAAESMAAAGFMVEPIVPTSAELAYLEPFDARFRTMGHLFLVSCDAGRVIQAGPGGARRCAAHPGLKKVSITQAKSMGIVKSSDFKPARSWASKVLRYVVFASDAPEAEAVAAAKETMAIRADVARMVVDLSNAARISERPLKGKALVIWEDAARWLGRTAQPAAVLSAAWGIPLGPKPVKVKGPSGASVGIAFTAPSWPVVLGVIVVGLAAAAVYVAHQRSKALQIQKEIQQVTLDETAELRRCVADKSEKPEMRANCAAAIKDLKPPEAAPDLATQLVEAAPYITGLALLGAGIVYFGPVAKEVGKTGAQGIKAVRQGLTRQQRQG